MRRFLLSAAVLCTLAFGQAFGQGVFTGYELSDFQREGTARSVAMGNAMTALGGDLGAIAINPAASAVFKYNEFAFTPAVTSVKTESKYLGVGTNVDKSSFGLANLGGVAVIRTGRSNGLKSVTFGFSYNKHNNFNASIKAGAEDVDDSYARHLTAMANASPYSGRDFDDNANPDPFSYGSYYWPVILGWNSSLMDTLGTAPHDVFYPTPSIDDPSYRSTQLLYRKSTGSIGEYDLNFGFNLSDKFYLGMNVGMFTVWNRVEEKYSEDNTSAGELGDTFSYMDQYYTQKTTGSGINLKFGFIWAPNYNFRVGASISTPTWYSLTDKYYWDSDVAFKDGYSASLHTPEGVYDYRFNAPFHYNVGFAAIFKNGSISVDYEGSNIANARFRNNKDINSIDYSDYSSENNWMTENFKMANKLRVGAEVYPVSNVALRAGFQYSDSGVKKDLMNTAIQNYTGSLGVGMTFGGGFYLDLAVAASLKKSTVPFFDTEPIADYVLGNPNFAQINRSNIKVLATFGWRF